MNNNIGHDFIALCTTENKSNKEIALKLHWSFAHLQKLLKLINNTRKEQSENVDLKREVKEITNNCEICKRYKEAPPQQVAPLPMASRLQETVAMDLKYY